MKQGIIILNPEPTLIEIDEPKLDLIAIREVMENFNEMM